VEFPALSYANARGVLIVLKLNLLRRLLTLSFLLISVLPVKKFGINLRRI
jgi:hypothetical protein